MRVETITHENGEQLPLLLDGVGLPLPTPNEFIMGRRFLSTNTLVRNLRELAVFYRWLENQKIDLWQRIHSGLVFTEAEIRGSLVEALRREQANEKKVSRLTVSPHTFNLRLTTIRQFLVWCFDMHLSSMSLTDNRYERIREQQTRLLNWLDTAFISAPPENRNKKKALTDKQAGFLIKCLDPNNPDAIGRNPAVKFRNYISTLIMLYFGIRPGELLSLKVKDIEIGAISAIRIERRPADLKDSRKPRPKIKRNGRVMPIDDPIFARHLDEYIMIWREQLEANADCESEYLILSDDGRPLSQSTLIQLYQGLRERFADDLPQHLTAKALRHTFSSNMGKILRQAGIDEIRCAETLAYLRGDANLNSQLVYTVQEVEEQANRALKKFQQGLLR